MKPWMVILGLLAILVVVGTWTLGNAFSTLSTESDRAKAAATAFSNNLVASGWTLAPFTKDATPDYLKTLTAAGDGAFAKYTVLGKPQSAESCSLFRLNITNGVGTAQVNCPMTFTTGKATLNVSLFGGGTYGWKVSGLGVQL